MGVTLMQKLKTVIRPVEGFHNRRTNLAPYFDEEDNEVSGVGPDVGLVGWHVSVLCRHELEMI
jgi:hypothetical protein